MAFGQWLVQDDELVCRLPRKSVTVSAPGPLLRRVLELCDGRRAWKAVAAELSANWDEGSVEPFLTELSAQGLLIEAGESLAAWSDVGQLPHLYPATSPDEELPTLHQVAQDRLLPGTGGSAAVGRPAPSQLVAILNRRRTSRTFADTPLDASVLASILWAAQGVTTPGAGGVKWHRTVASGGNMHSARWFVAVLRELPADPAIGTARAMAPGLYEALFHQQGGVSFVRQAADASSAWRMLQDPRTLRFASAFLVSIHDVAVPARKYGNRAALFANIEAGQSLQNAQLMATALGAAAMVCGNTVAPAVLKGFASGLGPNAWGNARWQVMPGLLLGSTPTDEQARLQGNDNWIQLTETGGPNAGGSGASRQPEQFAFSAGPVAIGNDMVWAGGRSDRPEIAVLKAEAEAWERLGWGSPSGLVAGRARDIVGARIPSEVAAYSPAQYASKGFPCSAFSRQRKYLWKQGVDVATGSPAALPAEFIYALEALPPAVQKSALTNTSTSGVAAWTDSEGALCRATLELLERDRVLKAWLRQETVNAIAVPTLPEAIQGRVAALEDRGYEVAISEVGGPLALVYTVFLRRHDRPFAALTASADFNGEVALSKALDEAEGRALQVETSPEKPIVRRADVQGLTGVSRYYQSPRFYRRSDFMGSGPHTRKFRPNAGARNWLELKSALEEAGLGLLAFDLTPENASIDQGRQPLRVMRAVVPGLVPIWFHHGLEPAGLAAFQEACIPPSGSIRRHIDFIHPFT